MDASAANATLPPDGNQTVFDEWATEVVTAVYLYYTPLLVALGCVGNGLSVWVFHKSKLRHLSTSIYLTALAISDSIFLLHLLPPWMSAAHVSSVFHSSVWCPVFTYCSYVTCCCSAWLVVAFTLERCVAVLRPLRRDACTTRHSRGVTCGVLALAAVLNFPVGRFAARRNGECSVDVAYETHAARFNVVDMTLAFTVPMAAIVVLNGCIAINVCQLGRARRCLGTEREPGSPPPACSPRNQRRVTRMMVIVSSVFVVLNLPAYIFRIMAYGYGLNAAEVGGRWTALQQISVILFHTNFGINFILYCLSGQNFRRALVQALPCCRRRRPLPPRATNVSTEMHPDRIHSVTSTLSTGVEVGGATSAIYPTTSAGAAAALGSAGAVEGAAPAAPKLTRTAAVRRRHVNARGAATSGSASRHRPDATRATIETASETSAAAAARRRPERFIRRWIFDNSRGPRPALRSGVTATRVEEVELDVLSGLGGGTGTAYIHTTQF